MGLPQHIPLPPRDGVSASFVWCPKGDWPCFLDFLLERFPGVTREAWLSRMARGEVLDMEAQRVQPDSAFRSGACLFYYREIEDEADIPFQEQILYVDEHLVVADKPHFLPVIPSGRFLQQTLLVRLKRRLNLPDLVPIHRIDRETAGIVIFSHNASSRGRYQALFRERVVSKVYEAVAPLMANVNFPYVHRSRIEQGERFFTMRECDGEPNTETRIELLARNQTLAWYRLFPLTGRQHQLRVHLAALGAPILHDGFYPVALPDKGDDFSQPLQLLARSLQFVDPISGWEREFVSQYQLAAIQQFL